MAREAKVKVVVDVEDAKREMDAVNQRLTTTKERGTKMAGALKGIAMAASAGVTALAGGVEAISGPGVPALGLGATRDVLGGLGLDLLGTDPFGPGGDFLKAHNRAVEAVSRLVSAGGDVSDMDLEGMIGQFRELYEPGERNQRLARAAGKRLLKQEVAEGDVMQGLAKDFANAVQNFENAVNNFKSMLGIGG